MGKDTDFDYGFNQNEPASYACMGRCVCALCGKFHGYCSEVGASPQTENRGNNVNVGQHVKSSGQGAQNPFIQPEQVSKKGTVFTVVGAREVNSPPRKATKDKKASNGFFGLMVDIKNGTKKFCLPIRYDRFDLAKMCKQMKSEDTDDWMGRKVKLVRVDGSKGGHFVNVA